jgi:DNA-binding transcriptional regulator YhcF (GntR family)
VSLVLEIDRDAEEPVYGQVARQVRLLVAAGTLPPGARLPAVRELARDLGVNLNTVARAYRELEDDGFVTMRDRERAVVAPPAQRAEAARTATLRGELRELLARMRQAGIAGAAIRRMVADETGRLESGGDGR